MVKLASATPIFIDTDEKSGFKVSPEKLKAALTKKTKVIVLNSPANPTGCVYNVDELKKIRDIVVKNNILVISDEIYEEIIFDQRVHVSIASLGDDIFNQTIVVNGASKSFAMTGWRIGYAGFSDEKIAAAVKNLQSHSTSNPTSISQEAALQALKEKTSDVKNMVTEFERRRDYIVGRIKDIKGLSCERPGGAFYVFPRIEKKDIASMELSERLLAEAKVAVVPGKAFGSDRHVRLSFATSMENIKNGMDRIETWFNK